MDLKDKIRSIPDYPQKGVIFRDITTLLKDAESMVQSVEDMQAKLDGVEFDLVLGPESRGFIFGMPVAYNMKKGFVPVRKKGKLPAEVISWDYDRTEGCNCGRPACDRRYGKGDCGDGGKRRG